MFGMQVFVVWLMLWGLYTCLSICIIPWLGLTTLSGALNTSLYVTVISMLAWCYHKACSTEPGSPPRDWMPPTHGSDIEMGTASPTGATPPEGCIPPGTHMLNGGGTTTLSVLSSSQQSSNLSTAGLPRALPIGATTTGAASGGGGSESGYGGGAGPGGGGGTTSPLLTSDAAPAVKFCKMCQRHKPPRTHHCRMCNRCVLRMDHHCPWVNNCVGHYNYKFFVLFLCYTILTIAYSLGLLIARALFSNINITAWEGVAMLILGMVCLPTGILVFCLFWYHAGLILSNMTTIESHESYFHQWSKPNSRYQHEYDLGWRENLYQLFGRDFRYWLIPVGPTTDGCSYPTRNAVPSTLYL